MTPPRRPRLTLGHTTLAVRDLDVMVAFYTEVLGFHVTNRGAAGPDSELVFISQDPEAHHQIVLVSGMGVGEHQFVLADHLAFRTDSLHDLRLLKAGLEQAGVDDLMAVSHGNAWSIYFTDPEGNGLECFVDTPYHVAQPYLDSIDLDLSDAELDASTKDRLQGQPEFQSFADWRAAFTDRLAAGGA